MVRHYATVVRANRNWPIAAAATAPIKKRAKDLRNNKARDPCGGGRAACHQVARVTLKQVQST